MSLQLLAARAAQNHRGGGVTYATLSTLYTSGSISLSSGNLVATNTAGAAGISRSNSSLIGKQYFEVVVSATAGIPYSWACGVCNASAGLSVSLGYANPNGWGFWNAALMHNGAPLYSTRLSAGDTVMVAYDSAAGNLWFGKNGTWTNSGSPDPATGSDPDYAGITDTLFPAVCPWGSSAGDSVCTIKFNPATFSYSLPSGFGPVI